MDQKIARKPVSVVVSNDEVQAHGVLRMPVLEAEDDLEEMETLLRALACTLDHDDYEEERETMMRLTLMAKHRLLSIRKTLGY
jgi:hypothetical protein